MELKNHLIIRTYKVIILFIFVINDVIAQSSKYTVQEYIETYKGMAIKEMKEYGIPASITLAQGIIESGFGNGYLVQKGNNHFGIKCNNGWTGDTILKDDDNKNDCFRKYKDANESFRDHSEFLRNSKRYASLFELSITDYKGWANGLKSSGYATAPDYAQKLINIIEENKLYVYDTVEYYQLVDNIEGITTENTLLSNASSSDMDVVVFSGGERKVLTRNGISYVIAKEGDNPVKLGQEFQIAPFLIKKFNDIKKGQAIKPGQIIYLEPKKTKAEKDYHIVKEGESMYSISQYYGIKLNKLYKRNNMLMDQEPKAGQKLRLNK